MGSPQAVSGSHVESHLDSWCGWAGETVAEAEATGLWTLAVRLAAVLHQGLAKADSLSMWGIPALICAGGEAAVAGDRGGLLPLQACWFCLVCPVPGPPLDVRPFPSLRVLRAAIRGGETGCLQVAGTLCGARWEGALLLVRSAES